MLAAVGDVDARDVIERARRAFGAWPRGPVVPPGEPPPAQAPPARRVLIVDRPDLVQARILIAHEGIARSDPDRVAAGLLNSVLGGSGFSSRLMARVRSEAGLTYSVGSGFSLRRAPGPFVVSTFTRVPEVRRAIDLLLGELARARSQPPAEAELGPARTLAVGEFSLGLETSEAVMSSLVDLDVHGLPEDGLDSYRGRVRAVSAAEIAALAQRLLHPERSLILLVGPAAELTPAARGSGPRGGGQALAEVVGLRARTGSRSRCRRSSAVRGSGGGARQLPTTSLRSDSGSSTSAPAPNERIQARSSAVPPTCIASSTPPSGPGSSCWLACQVCSDT